MRFEGTDATHDGDTGGCVGQITPKRAPNLRVRLLQNYHQILKLLLITLPMFDPKSPLPTIPRGPGTPDNESDSDLACRLGRLSTKNYPTRSKHYVMNPCVNPICLKYR
jgi:hypothetical protein